MTNNFQFANANDFSTQLQIKAISANNLSKIDPSAANTKAAFADLYGFIINAISTSGSPNVGVDPAVWEWVNGAKSVNVNTGYFANFIRQYTETQYDLRYGSDSITQTVLETRIQAASNQIALNLANDIINRITHPELFPSQLPDIAGVATDDAGAASTLFQGNFSPWAGTVLFNYLGDTTPFQEWVVNLATHQDDGVTRKALTGTYDLVSVAAVNEQLSSASSIFQAFLNSPELIASTSGNGYGLITTQNCYRP